MSSFTETQVARCENCGELVALTGNTIRLWDSAPPSRVAPDGQVVLSTPPTPGLLLVCPSCRSRTRITDLP
jgi:hypothetical protein